jgi:hypothetical protein
MCLIKLAKLFLLMRVGSVRKYLHNRLCHHLHFSNIIRRVNIAYRVLGNCLHHPCVHSCLGPYMLQLGILLICYVL